MASICCIPLLNTESHVLGVLELETCFLVTNEDVKLLECFAVFASVTLEKSELKEIADFGHVEVRMKQYIGEEERHLVDRVPTKLAIPIREAATLFQVGFDAQAWDGVGHFKVLWALFTKFDLFNLFHIKNERFYKFLDEMSLAYNDVPYHNWRHAVDVTQFVTYQIVTAQLQYELSKFQILALLIAAICHDANHDGFASSYNLQAQTPLGILFKNQSVMEMHHCSVAIRVISDPDRNIFEGLSPAETKDMWTLVLMLILGTDMGKHFPFVKEVNDRLATGPLVAAKPEDSVIILQLLLHCADLSNVCRPFKLADKWCGLMCEEFFHQGEIEKATGIEYTDEIHDREHLDKPKCQMGIVESVCLPLYETAARALPQLEVNAAAIRANIAAWKSQAERRERIARRRLAEQEALLVS
jgi:hypothetical protein